MTARGAWFEHYLATLPREAVVRDVGGLLLIERRPAAMARALLEPAPCLQRSTKVEPAGASAGNWQAMRR